MVLKRPEIMNIKYEEIKKRLNQVFKEVFDDDDLQIFDEMTANDLEEWDSLMHVSILVELDSKFKADLSKISNLQDANSIKKIIKILYDEKKL